MAQDDAISFIRRLVNRFRPSVRHGVDAFRAGCCDSLHVTEIAATSCSALRLP